MLKLYCTFTFIAVSFAATFGWLCVETASIEAISLSVIAATFGWLCVETYATLLAIIQGSGQPPSGGCVLKL